MLVTEALAYYKAIVARISDRFTFICLAKPKDAFCWCDDATLFAVQMNTTIPYLGDKGPISSKYHGGVTSHATVVS